MCFKAKRFLCFTERSSEKLKPIRKKMKFADPKNDIAFKKIFGDKNKTEVLISFLNSALDFKDNREIKSVKIDNTYQLSQIEELKDTILDIKATNYNNEEFIIEMQKKDIGDFSKRSLYYTSKAYISQINKAEDYLKLKKVYYIAIVDFKIFDNKSFISNHLIINQETTKQDLKDMEFTFIELPKFAYKLNECDSIIKKWIYFINNASSLDLIPKEFEDIKEFQTAFQIANTYTWNKKELSIYDRISLKKGDDINALSVAENKGVVRGIEKGIKQEKLNIAKNLLDILDDKTISIKTGLSIKDIQALR
jgi:predicted transposase/invertase (TIGR01784 family)